MNAVCPFLNPGRQIGQAFLDPQGALHDLAAHDADNQERERIRGKRNQGQNRVHGKHGRHAIRVV